MIIVPQRRAVDPRAMSLAMLPKTAYRYSRGPAQLRGLGLNISSSLETIAEFDPEPYSHTALEVAAKVKNFIAMIENFFGIGAGRKEADMIVPTQNQMTDEILAPVNVEILRGTALSCNTLAMLYQKCMEGWLKWIQFLHETDWSDGRAAVQAEATLAPYWRDLIGDINSGTKGKLELIWDQKRCGTWDDTYHGGGPSDPGGGIGPFVGPIAPGGFFDLMGGGNTPLLVGLGLLAFYLFGRRR